MYLNNCSIAFQIGLLLPFLLCFIASHIRFSRFPFMYNIIHTVKAEFSRHLSFKNRAINQKRSTTEMSTFRGCQVFICQQHEACTCLFSGERLHVWLFVRMHLCPRKHTHLFVRDWVCYHMCAGLRVFLGVFSGRELSGMMTDVTPLIHTPTLTPAQMRWQVKAVAP